MADSPVNLLLGELRSVLSADDDEGLWQEVLTTLVKDVELLLRDYRGKAHVLLEIGPCSRWLRPHQTRWTAAGGFAWPTGYGDGEGGYSRLALPQLHQSRVFHTGSDGGHWRSITGRPGRRPLVLRIAIPTRSCRHEQAAVHTLWQPGSPTHPREKQLRFLGFRHQEGQWRLVADSRPLWDKAD